VLRCEGLGETLFSLECLTKVSERERRQLDRITELLHDIADKLIAEENQRRDD